MATHRRRHRAREHVAELRAGRIGDDPLDVVLHQTDRRREEGGGGADDGDHGRAPGARQLEQRRQRATRNTPAVTMVAAWMSAETGVGPSIASGSQVCSRNCADLPMAPDEEQQADRGQYVDLHNRGTCHGLARIVGRRGEDGRRSRSRRKHEDGEDAEREAEIADAVDDECLDRRRVGRRGFLYQKPISRYDASPTPSQPKNSWTRLSDVTSISIAKVKSER